METWKLVRTHTQKKQDKWRVARIITKFPILVFPLHTLTPSFSLNECCRAWEIQLQSLRKHKDTQKPSEGGSSKL